MKRVQPFTYPALLDGLWTLLSLLDITEHSPEQMNRLKQTVRLGCADTFALAGEEPGMRGIIETTNLSNPLSASRVKSQGRVQTPLLFNHPTNHTHTATTQRRWMIGMIITAHMNH